MINMSKVNGCEESNVEDTLCKKPYFTESKGDPSIIEYKESTVTQKDCQDLLEDIVLEERQSIYLNEIPDNADRKRQYFKMCDFVDSFRTANKKTNLVKMSEEQLEQKIREEAKKRTDEEIAKIMAEEMQKRTFNLRCKHDLEKIEEILFPDSGEAKKIPEDDEISISMATDMTKKTLRFLGKKELERIGDIIFPESHAEKNLISDLLPSDIKGCVTRQEEAYKIIELDPTEHAECVDLFLDNNPQFQQTDKIKKIKSKIDENMNNCYEHIRKRLTCTEDLEFKLEQTTFSEEEQLLRDLSEPFGSDDWLEYCAAFVKLDEISLGFLQPLHYLRGPDDSIHVHERCSMNKIYKPSTATRNNYREDYADEYTTDCSLLDYKPEFKVNRTNELRIPRFIIVGVIETLLYSHNRAAQHYNFINRRTGYSDNTIPCLSIVGDGKFSAIDAQLAATFINNLNVYTSNWHFNNVLFHLIAALSQIRHLFEPATYDILYAYIENFTNHAWVPNDMYLGFVDVFRQGDERHYKIPRKVFGKSWKNWLLFTPETLSLYGNPGSKLSPRDTMRLAKWAKLFESYFTTRIESMFGSHDKFNLKNIVSALYTSPNCSVITRTHATLFFVPQSIRNLSGFCPVTFSYSPYILGYQNDDDDEYSSDV